MDRALNREVLRLALPSIAANLTVPLVGMVDTAIAGHIPAQGALGAAAFIGAISIGSMLFNLLYWNFSFLRTGTGGLTAQAFGRGDMHACAQILGRGLVLALAFALLSILLQKPFVGAALLLLQGTPEVEGLARQYFFIRIWAAPATISLMAFNGWFVGMQDSMSSMWKDFVVNGVNIVASLAFAHGVGPMRPMGFAGIALGTVAAQYTGLLFCLLVCLFKYRRSVFAEFRISEISSLLSGNTLRKYMKMNADLFGRSLGFTAIYIGYTMIAARFGNTLLACSSIMMHLLMIFSYFTDGFAYAGEALTGRFIGAGDSVMMRRSIRYVFVWSMAIAVLFMGLYQLAGMPLLRFMTSDEGVVASCRQFLPWLIMMPPLGCAAFTWDGIYMGATASREIRNSMLGAAVAFFGTWFAGLLILSLGGADVQGWTPAPLAVTGMHLLLGAYFAHLLFRMAYLSCKYKKVFT